MKKVLVTLVALIVMALGTVKNGMAVQWTVNTTSDSHAPNGVLGELRYAIVNANGVPPYGSDIIYFDPLIAYQSITLTAALPIGVSAYGLTIDGGTNHITVCGANTSTDIFDIAGNGCTIRNLCLIDSHYAINFTGSGTVNTLTVANCRIGIDYNENADPNNTGIAMSNATGGAIALLGNIISNNTTGGIYANACSYISITNNYIGTDSTGMIAQINMEGMGFISCSRCTIGTNTLTRNIIASSVHNITFSLCNTMQVFGNIIGLNANATAKLGNDLLGVVLANSSNNFIGKPADTNQYYNIIGGSVFGIDLNNNSSGNTIQANYIGSVSAPNGTGIDLASNASGNLIGGNLAAGAANVICSNTSHGINIESGQGNTICGNYIGTNAAGNALPNGAGASAIWVQDAYNLIGGSNLNLGNIFGNFISGNPVTLTNAANNTSIRGNCFGANPATGAQLDTAANLSLDGTSGNVSSNAALAAPLLLTGISFAGGSPGIIFSNGANSNKVLNQQLFRRAAQRHGTRHPFGSRHCHQYRRGSQFHR